MIWKIEIKVHSKQKSMTFFGLNFVQQNVYIYVYFALIYNILNPHKISQTKSVKKKYLYKVINKRLFHIFQLQMFIILY
jgi:hypothetical protein